MKCGTQCVFFSFATFFRFTVMLFISIALTLSLSLAKQCINSTMKKEAPNYYIISDTNVSIFYVIFSSISQFIPTTNGDTKKLKPIFMRRSGFFLHYLRTSLFVYTIHSESTKELRLGSPIVASLQKKRQQQKNE